MINPIVYDQAAINAAASLRRLIRTKRRGYQSDFPQFNGLINEGTTCYLNSLLQTLFLLKAFRRAVYLMPTDVDDFKSIPFCLQRIFYNLQTGSVPVRTFELLNAFGWS